MSNLYTSPVDLCRKRILFCWSFEGYWFPSCYIDRILFPFFFVIIFFFPPSNERVVLIEKSNWSSFSILNGFYPFYRVILSNRWKNLCLSFDYIKCAELARDRSYILWASLYVFLMVGYYNGQRKIAKPRWKRPVTFSTNKISVPWVTPVTHTPRTQRAKWDVTELSVTR